MTSTHKLAELRGVIPAIVTPFDAASEVDHATLETLTGRLVAGGVHAIMATGGTGEFPHLDPGERAGRGPHHRPKLRPGGCP